MSFLLKLFLLLKREIHFTFKAAVLKNAEDNLRTLAAKEDTCFYMWSAMDLEETKSLDERVNIIRPLLLIFCNETVHQVLEIGDKENSLKEDVWQGYTIHFCHPKRLLGSVSEVEAEFRDAWPVLSRIWLTQRAKSAKEKKEPSQLDVLSRFCQAYAGEFPNICLLFQILIATPSNSSPVERSYSILQIICEQRRNSLTPAHIEMLYILTVLKLDVKQVEHYLDCLEYLEN